MFKDEEDQMNTLCKFVAPAILGIAIGSTATSVHASSKGEPDLRAEAKISEQAAAKTALARVVGGKIKSAELERENGYLVWSFDVSTPSSKNITEVQVDAVTGRIVSEVVETPSDQAAEAAADGR